MKHTFAMVKPDATERGLEFDFESIFEINGFSVPRWERRLLSRIDAEFLYAEHAAKPFFGDLVKYITSGKTVLMTLYLPDQSSSAVAEGRRVLSELRALYALDFRRNSIHASDSIEAATRELNYFFPGVLK